MNKCPYLLFHFSILMVHRLTAACGRPLVHIALLFRSYALSRPYKVVLDEIWYEVEGGGEGSFVFATTLR